MFEGRHEPLISRGQFTRRVAASLGVAMVADTLAVMVGAAGYHWLDGMNWLAACVNGAMVITGNGLVNQVHTTAGRLFSIFDAILGVIAFISVTGVLLAPVFHRLLHSFHLEAGDQAT